LRFAVDSNILVYAFDRSDERKHQIAVRIMNSAPLLDCVLPAQALGEFLNVIRRKHRGYFEEARAQVSRWTDILTILETSPEHIEDGAELADSHSLQFWDGVTWQIAASARSRLLLSEDFQDHRTIDRMKVLNPFDIANEAELHNLLRSADEEIQW
jgi:predicted nucleic acid-binding protein